MLMDFFKGATLLLLCFVAFTAFVVFTHYYPRAFLPVSSAVLFVWASLVVVGCRKGGVMMTTALRTTGLLAGLGAGNRFYLHDWFAAAILFGTALCCLQLANRETPHD